MFWLLFLIILIIILFTIYASFKNVDDENIRKEFDELIKEIEKELRKNEKN